MEIVPVFFTYHSGSRKIIDKNIRILSRGVLHVNDLKLEDVV